MAKIIFTRVQNNMKINSILLNSFYLKPLAQAPNIKLNALSADSVSFTATRKLSAKPIELSTLPQYYVDKYKIADITLYDRDLKKYVQADLTDDGKKLKIFKNDEELGQIGYAIEKATSEGLVGEFIPNYHPSANLVTRGHNLVTDEAPTYRGVGTVLIKSLIQKSLSNGTGGSVVVYAFNNFKTKGSLSPIPFYAQLGFKPRRLDTQMSLYEYQAETEVYKEGLIDEKPCYYGPQKDWMYLSKDKIAEYKKEFQKNPVY